MKLVYLHQTRETLDLLKELFNSRKTDFTIKVESNRKTESITTYEETAGSWNFDTAAKIQELEESGRITVIENSEPTDGTWKYWEIKRDRGFADV